MVIRTLWKTHYWRYFQRYTSWYLEYKDPLLRSTNELHMFTKEFLTVQSIDSWICGRGLRKCGASHENGCSKCPVGNPWHFTVLQGFPRNFHTFNILRKVPRKSQTMGIVPEYPGFWDKKSRKYRGFTASYSKLHYSFLNLPIPTGYRACLILLMLAVNFF